MNKKESGWKGAKSKSQEAALARIKQLNEDLKGATEDARPTYDLGTEVTGWTKLYSMLDLEEKFEKSLKEVEALIKEHALDDSVLLEFKKEAAEKIYSEGMQRKEYEWAAAFAKKHGL